MKRECGWRCFLTLLCALIIPACGTSPSHDLFTLSTNSITFTAPAAGPGPQDQVVSMTASDRLTFGHLNWQATSNQSWLTLSPGLGTLGSGQTGSFTLHVNHAVQSEAWLGATSTTGAPFVDANTWSGSGAWVGNAMLIWSGDPTIPGKFYDPVSDTWYGSTSTVNAPSNRLSFSAVWTGTEMIVWGGYVVVGGSPTVALNTGARYNPATATWTTMSTVGAPSPRTAHRAVWTGSHMIVWGGDGLGFTYTNTGGIYDPATDTWTQATSTVNAPSPRGSAAAVWTGSRMIVWGGENPGKFNTGYFYDPQTDTWTGTTTTVGAPAARSHMPGVWTGQEMIIWGGDLGGGNDQNDGARYNPTTDTWTAMTVTGVPEARSSHTSVWTGNTMIAWGGVSPTTNINTGGIYQPPSPVSGSYNAQITILATTLGDTFSRSLPVTLLLTP